MTGDIDPCACLSSLNTPGIIGNASLPKAKRGEVRRISRTVCCIILTTYTCEVARMRRDTDLSGDQKNAKKGKARTDNQHTLERPHDR